jgi:hypothetical protein
MKVQTSITYIDPVSRCEIVNVYTHSDVKLAKAWVAGMIEDGYTAKYLGKPKKSGWDVTL